MHEQDVAARLLERELPGGLEERQALDVPDRPPDLRDRDVDFSIYEVPTNLVDAGIDNLLAERLGLQLDVHTQIDDWRAMLQQIKHTKDEVEIALVGKYTELHDAYKSIYESLSHAGIGNRAKIKV
ncbi:MAG: hypothetical protein ACKVXR_16940, partial [Planctomycetota bacterium]